MKVDLYLTFDGNCEEAFNFYKEVFGGEFCCKMTWADNPHKDKGKVPLDEAKAKQIMHMSLRLTDHTTLMGCDQPPEGNCCGGEGDIEPPQKLIQGNNFQINLEPDSKEHADKLIQQLSAKGGKILVPMEEQFWKSYFGMCKDAYGITWMFNYPLDETKEEKKEGN